MRYAREETRNVSHAMGYTLHARAPFNTFDLQQRGIHEP